jgi:hypothetical protein
MRFRLRNIEKGNAAARNAADRKHRVEHVRRMLVGGVFGSTGHFEHTVEARERLPNVRAVANVRRRL